MHDWRLCHLCYSAEYDPAGILEHCTTCGSRQGSWVTRAEAIEARGDAAEAEAKEPMSHVDACIEHTHDLVVTAYGPPTVDTLMAGLAALRLHRAPEHGIEARMSEPWRNGIMRCEPPSGRGHYSFTFMVGGVPLLVDETVPDGQIVLRVRLSRSSVLLPVVE